MVGAKGLCSKGSFSDQSVWSADREPDKMASSLDPLPVCSEYIQLSRLSKTYNNKETLQTTKNRRKGSYRNSIYNTGYHQYACTKSYPEAKSCCAVCRLSR